MGEIAIWRRVICGCLISSGKTKAKESAAWSTYRKRPKPKANPASKSNTKWNSKVNNGYKCRLLRRRMVVVVWWRMPNSLADPIKRSKFPKTLIAAIISFITVIFFNWFSMDKLKTYRRIRDKIRKEMWYMYRSAENAFAELDFSGLGYVTEKSFLTSNLVKHRIPYSEAEIKMFFKEYNLFRKNSKGMLMDEFKKNFFPHLYLV